MNLLEIEKYEDSIFEAIVKRYEDDTNIRFEHLGDDILPFEVNLCAVNRFICNIDSIDNISIDEIIEELDQYLSRAKSEYSFIAIMPYGVFIKDDNKEFKYYLKLVMVNESNVE